MASTNTPRVTTPFRVLSLQPRRERRGRTAELRHAPEIRGRAWINGREVGGTEPRFAHLSAGHD